MEVPRKEGKSTLSISENSLFGRILGVYRGFGFTDRVDNWPKVLKMLFFTAISWFSYPIYRGKYRLAPVIPTFYCALLLEIKAQNQSIPNILLIIPFVYCILRG